VLIGIEYQCLHSVDVGEEICIVAAGCPLLTVVGAKDVRLFPLKFLTLASVTCRSARGVDFFVTHARAHTHTHTLTQTHTHTNTHTRIPVTYLLLNLKQFPIVLAKIKATYSIESVGHICGLPNKRQFTPRVITNVLKPFLSDQRIQIPFLHYRICSLFFWVQLL
jgi:hypothetical protein